MLSAHHDSTLMNRRQLLEVGYSGLLGAGLPFVFSAQALAAKSPGEGDTTRASRQPKSVIIVFLTGAASHLDTFDMKPDAPREIRGEFRPIATPVPGLHVCEHLPLLAARADKYALIRTLSHGDNNHLMSTHHLLTGTKQPGAFFDKVASRDDWPSYSSACAYLRPRRDGVPSGVNLPTFLLQGPLTWPGQHAGFLGPRYDPWQITRDPNKKGFRVDALQLPPGIDVTRLKNRRALLSEINKQQKSLEKAAEAMRLADDQQLAFSLLTSSRLARAFELNRETEAVRNRYGRNTTGQSLLLGRRLLQAGVPVVQVNVGRVQTWDNHNNIFPTLKNRLLPPLDQGVSALLDDLERTGRLKETLVMMLGEFGRTPKINKKKG
ncbi:MAG: DUF1501 domain-containing protein, partial [Planctomycetes bacterium]|nr:DUF1501 domain-containing protein [Planctomycetota bacterium]